LPMRQLKRERRDLSGRARRRSAARR